MIGSESKTERVTPKGPAMLEDVIADQVVAAAVTDEDDRAQDAVDDDEHEEQSDLELVKCKSSVAEHAMISAHLGGLSSLVPGR